MAKKNLNLEDEYLKGKHYTGQGWVADDAPDYTEGKICTGQGWREMTDEEKEEKKNEADTLKLLQELTQKESGLSSLDPESSE